MVINFGIMITYRKYLKKRELMTLAAYIMIPAAGVVFHVLVEGTPVNLVSITLAIVYYFAIIQSELSKQIKQHELELTESRVSIMLSQIQPHFLHNVLSSIAQLCGENPVKAKKAVMDFSTYLRSNMESLNHKGLINVEKEINHVKGYLDLEKAMYGDALTVVYRVEAAGFSLPPLTIQPIAENAVKHGIGQNESGGTVTVSVCETDYDFAVTVSDDGAGYDTADPRHDGRAHIGIENVRRRLEQQCGGTLDISSETGKGTTAVITIPKTKA